MKLYSIKPLEWEQSGQDYLGGLGGFVDYEILQRKDEYTLGITAGDRHNERGEFDNMYYCKSLAEAKAAAQADWEERISKYLIEVEG